MATPIVLAMDNESVQNINVLIYSIFKHIPNPQIYLITDKQLDIWPEWVFQSAVLDLDVRTKYGHWTKHMFLDLYIDVLFPELQKCIYLDFDTIVMQDISDLLLGDDWILKVADHRNVRFDNPMRLNSGVLAFNFNDRCKQLLKKARLLINDYTHDEEIIKNVFIPANAITYVNKNYNVLAGCLDEFNNPKVLHYAGIAKRWTLYESYGIYFEYLKQAKSKITE